MKTILSKKAFTLIEMLIVVVIIGILATALIPRLQDVQGRARDTQRKVDIRTLANALEIYFQDHNKYPYIISDSNIGYRSATQSNGIVIDGASESQRNITGDNRLPMLAEYLTSIPKDPINKSNCTNGWGENDQSCYTYAYGTPLNVGDSLWTFYYLHLPPMAVATYDLYVPLENTDDAETCMQKNYGRAGDSTDRCNSIYTWWVLPKMYDYSPNVKNTPM